MKIDKKNPLHWWLLAQQALYSLLAALLRPLRRKPPKPLVVLYGHQLSGNLKALYTAWDKECREQFDLFFLSLDPGQAQALRNAGIAVLACNRLRDMLRLTQARVMITDHGLHLMTPLLRLTDIVFVDVWHGIPFKGFVPADFQLQQRYEEVWVSSPLLQSLYEKRFGFRRGPVRPLGYARTDRLFQRPPPASGFLHANGVDAARGVVLYAPTWQQDDAGRELFPFGHDQASFIELLSRACAEYGALLVVRAHLNTSIPDGGPDNVMYCSQRDFPDTEDLLLGSDVLICDWSSIAFDFLALDRPTLFLDVEPPFRNGFSLGPEYRFGAIIDNSDALDRELRAALAAPRQYHERFAQQHRAVTAAVYGEATDGQAGRRQLQHLYSRYMAS